MEKIKDYKKKETKKTALGWQGGKGEKCIGDMVSIKI